MGNVVSRRDFLRYMSILGTMVFYSVPLYAKTTKAIVKYQYTPNKGNSCKMCMHFIPETNECKIVEGSISPNGWCTSFFKNPNYKPA
ncbi:MAG: high-potential iron-sulfur protein [Sulfurovaceae bacterium]|nr:high-potential iron-sulfur protein [Sulfurovaceae bacterium]